MVLAAVSPGDLASDTTSALIREPIPGVDTLSDSDRGVETLPIDNNDSARLPLVSRAVRPDGRTTSAARRLRPATTAVLRPARRNPEQVKSAAASCRQLDPIARFLASAKIGPRCQT